MYYPALLKNLLSIPLEWSPSDHHTLANPAGILWWCINQHHRWFSSWTMWTSMCMIWCGLTRSPLIISSSTPTMTSCQAPWVCSKGVFKTKSPVSSRIQEWSSQWGMQHIWEVLTPPIATCYKGWWGSFQLLLGWNWLVPFSWERRRRRGWPSRTGWRRWKLSLQAGPWTNSHPQDEGMWCSSSTVPWVTKR